MSVIDDIKQRLDIEEIVSQYVGLQKAGRNFKALCPFHSEKHASFFVFPERQSWHCFGACGTGGDIFSFVMKKEGMDFGQTLRLLAEKAGVSLADSSSPQKEAEERQKERLFQINEVAAEYYHHMLLSSSAGEMARSYIARRGLSSQTIDNFQLGFSSDSFEDLKEYLLAEGYEEAELVGAGLLVERESGGSYDRFRNRLMFPVRDTRGRVTGFGARALDEALPKYLNSPQTLIFDKSSSLYGIDRARAAIRKNEQAVIVEGYIDVLLVHQYGWENVIASMGTALAEGQLIILKKLTKKLVLALDADAAGEEATLRSEEVLNQALDKKVVPVPTRFGSVKLESVLDADIKVMVLPAGKDPDEVVREDASLWQQLIVDAKPMVDFILDTVIAKVDLDNAKDKSMAVDKLLPLLYRMKDLIQQGHYVQKLARILKIDVRALEDTLGRFRLAERKQRVGKNIRGYTPVATASRSSSPLEEYCMALLLQYSGLRTEGMKLPLDYFEHPGNRQLFLEWQQSADLSSLRNNLDVSLHDSLNNLLNRVFPPALQASEEIQRQTLGDCILRLKEQWLRNLEVKKEEVLAAEAESGEIETQLAKLEEQGIMVSEQLKEIFTKQGSRRQMTRRSER